MPAYSVRWRTVGVEKLKPGRCVERAGTVVRTRAPQSPQRDGSARNSLKGFGIASTGLPSAQCVRWRTANSEIKCDNRTR